MRQPLQVPPGVGRWLNFADRLDPVALDADLANDFTPSPVGQALPNALQGV